MNNRFLQRANKRISFGSAATLLAVVALFGQALGFLRTRFISTNFKLPEMDAFFAAFAIPDFFFFTIAAGALGVAFVPTLVDRLQAGDKKGVWDIASSLINVLVVAMLVVGMLIFVLADWIVGTLFSNLPEQSLHDAALIMRIISLNPLLFAISGVIAALQQTFGRFFFFALAPLVYNGSIIISIFIFKDTIGVIGLGVGALIGALLQLLVSYIGMLGLGFRYRLRIWWKNEHFRGVLRQLPPRSLDQGIDQVNSIVEINRAQLLATGSVAHYNLALTLHNVPIMLIGTSIATAAYPKLTERLSQKRPDLFRKEFLRILRMMIWVTVPVVIVAFFARGYLARIIFGSANDKVAIIFGYLTVAILFRIIYAMVSRWFYAQKDTKTPLYISIFAISLNILLAFGLARQESYGIAGLALAQSIVAVAEVLTLGGIMLWRDKTMIMDMYFWGGFGRIIAAAGFGIAAGFVAVGSLPLLQTDIGFLTLGLKLSIITAVTFVAYFVASAIFALEETKPVFQFIKKFALRPIKYY